MVGTNRPAKILTIGGSDSLAGGGIQADLATFNEYGFYGLSVLTSIATVTPADFEVFPVSLPVLQAQLASLSSVPDIAAVKLGLIGDISQVPFLVDFLRNIHVPIIIDPVLVVKEGDYQGQAALAAAYRQEILSLAEVVTPNLVELALLTNLPVITNTDMMQAANQALLETGVANVFSKGGQRLAGSTAVDIWTTATGSELLKRPMLSAVDQINGAGCTLSAAITANRANSVDLASALADAKDFVWQGLIHRVSFTNPNLGDSVWQAARRFQA